MLSTYNLRLNQSLIMTNNANREIFTNINFSRMTNEVVIYIIILHDGVVTAESRFWQKEEVQQVKYMLIGRIGQI